MRREKQVVDTAEAAGLDIRDLHTLTNTYTNDPTYFHTSSTVDLTVVKNIVSVLFSEQCPVTADNTM